MSVFDITRQSISSDISFDLPSLQPLSHDHALLSSDSFDVDAFLVSRVHIPLEELRGELRVYLGQLREELVQLINDDYEEFISLGTGLRGEGERLRRLETPLRRLTEEVEDVRGALLSHQEAVQARLNERTVLREERVSHTTPAELTAKGPSRSAIADLRNSSPRRNASRAIG